MKVRIDRLLVERGLAETRERAQAMVMSGSVLINNVPASKPGASVSTDAVLSLKDDPNPYVSRGGSKIEGAVRAFGLQVQGWVCVDVGASTGGFTHYLLLNGAQRVFAVDVDTRQLDWKVRKDSRVVTVELNARFLEPEHIGEAADLVTIDASFISLTMLLPRIPAVLKPGGHCLALVKPQFEVGRGKTGKKGIVRDPVLQQEAVARILQSGQDHGFECAGMSESPIQGRQGNREFFVLFRKP